MTRAKRHLAISWSRKPSPFLHELGIARRPPRSEPRAPDDPAFAALKAWRRERAQADEVPPYVVFHDRTLAEIAATAPRTIGDLAHVAGVGPAKLERYGADVLRVLAERREEEVEHHAGVSAHAVVVRPRPLA
jgi:superfamily II DNA helicase RecQ